MDALLHTFSDLISLFCNLCCWDLIRDGTVSDILFSDAPESNHCLNVISILFGQVFPQLLQSIGQGLYCVGRSHPTPVLHPHPYSPNPTLQSYTPTLSYTSLCQNMYGSRNMTLLCNCELTDSSLQLSSNQLETIG